MREPEWIVGLLAAIALLAVFGGAWYLLYILATTLGI